MLRRTQSNTSACELLRALVCACMRASVLENERKRERIKEGFLFYLIDRVRQ